MANVFLLTSQGNAMELEGNAYELVGSTTGQPTHSSADVDVANITGITYTNADSQGKTVYTDGERALSNYEMGGDIASPTNSTSPNITFKVSDTAPTSSQNGSTGYFLNCLWFDTTNGRIYRLTNQSAGTWVHQNTGSSETATWGGVFRTWIYGSSGVSRWVKLNGTQVWDYNQWPEGYARAWNLGVGDYIQMWASSAITIGRGFLPFTH